MERISAFVPMVSHLDHSEHSVKIIITEYGVADLRGKSPIQRARCIIDNCVHPDYKPLLEEYLAMGIKGHTPQNLKCCFAFHEELAASGDMHNVVGASIISNTNILHTYLKAIPNNFGMAFDLSKNYSYLCYMGNWEKQQDEKKESRERDQSRRENLGKFFYDLAKLTFAGLVIGGIATFDTELKESIFIYRAIVGGIATVIFAWIGNKIFK